jgi:hypothetical protein
MQRNNKCSTGSAKGKGTVMEKKKDVEEKKKADPVKMEAACFPYDLCSLFQSCAHHANTLCSRMTRGTGMLQARV